ncbi:hypothetical protein IJ847_02835 [Candidatus Saccharibacteria bacterium]|nr:hypothetical protein [Candidatus Saccharibacteria bacterium]
MAANLTGGKTPQKNPLEKLFPNSSIKWNKLNGKLEIAFVAAAVVMVIAFLLSRFWPGFATIAKIALVIGVILMIYKLSAGGLGVYAWATESFSRFVTVSIALVILAVIFAVLKWSTVAVITLLITAVFATHYLTKNWSTLKKRKNTTGTTASTSATPKRHKSARF